MKIGKYAITIGETIKTGISLIYTKLFFRKARLVRMPVSIRGNKKYLKYEEGFTTGYRCRFDLPTQTKKNSTLEIGKNCIMGDNCHFAAYEKLKIGNNVLFASNIYVSDLNHGNYKGKESTSPKIAPNDREMSTSPVEIGDNVWVGEKVSILPGVKISQGSIIGANAVVTKDIPEYSIAVGIPAKVVKKYNFKTEQWEKI